MTLIRVLICEDDGVSADGMHRHLLDLGHRPLAVAVSGDSAVALAGSLRPDLVLMNMHLGGEVDGIGAATLIRERYGIPSVFLITSRAEAVPTGAARARPLGYLAKPVDRECLRTVIEMALRAHGDLRTSESRYHALVQSSHDAIVTTDVDGRVIDWSPSAGRLFGYADAEAIGRPVAEFLVDPAAWLGADQEDAAPAPVTEVAVRHRDGRALEAHVSLARWGTREGRFITGVFRDVSEQRRQDAQLLIAESVIRNSPAVLFRWRAENSWPVEYVSSNVERVLGYTSEALVSGRVRFDTVVHPGDLTRVEREVACFTASGVDAFSQEYRVVTADGATLWVEDRTSVERDPSGRVTHYQGILQDTTERREGDAAARLQSAALNAAANAIVIANRAGVIEWANPAFCALTGYSQSEIKGRRPGDLLKSGKHDRAFYEDMWRTIVSGAVWQGEITNRRKDGSHYPEEQTITPVRDARGEITHFIGVKRDLTDQRLLEQQFLQAQKMEVLGRLAGGVAHDFNNLLTIINGTADIVLEDLADDDPIREALDSIHEAGLRAARLTRQLLSFSRRQIITPERLDIGAQLTGMRRMLQRLLGEDIALDIDVAPDLGHVMADPGQLEQVILNLAVNARDAMPGGGRLRLSAHDVQIDTAFATVHPDAQVGPHVLLAITDTGSGMSPEVQTRLFEPFFTTKEKGKGTGLGLATVYGIVKQAGGFVGVSSRLGAGTTFSVYMPAITHEGVPYVAPTTALLPRGTGTVLIVEDEPGLRALAARMLGSVGYDILEAQSGEEALELIERHEGRLDLVFTDVVMTGMTGIDLSERVEAIRPGTRVLFASGYADERLSQVVAGHPATFIAKPYALPALAGKVRDLLLDTKGDGRASR